MNLRLAADLSLPLDAVTQTFGILAARGAGKSNTAAVMAEEMFKAKLPFVVVDPARAWWGLRASRDGAGPGLPIPIFGGKRGDVPLERGGGTLVADLVVEHRLSCVLDITEFDSEASKKVFLLDFARRLYHRNEEPLHLFLEEADDYIPQRPMRDEAQLLRAWENIVRRGRNRGLGITLITQRSAALNKNVLTQVGTLIAMRTTGPQDRAAIEEWLKYHDESREIVASLPGLADGEAWVWSPQFLGKTVRVHVRLRQTFDSGATPKAMEGRRAPATLADVDLKAIHGRMAATIERAKQEDPRELRKQVAELRAELARVKAAPAAIVKEKRVEIPVLREAELWRLEAATEKVANVAERLRVAAAAVATSVAAAKAPPPVVPRTALIRAPQAMPRLGQSTSVMVSRRTARRADLPLGEQRVLTAIAQHADTGVSRQQLSVLTGYKRSSRDTYLQRLRARPSSTSQGTGSPRPAPAWPRLAGTSSRSPRARRCASTG